MKKILVALLAAFPVLGETKVHSTQAFVAAPVTVPNAGNTNDAGTSTSLSRADHSHALAVGPMLGATTAAGQSINNATMTIVVFGTVVRDSDAAYNSGTGRYTIPAGKGGDYLVACTINWQNNFTGTGLVALHKNAVETEESDVINPGATQSVSVTTIRNYAAGDIVDCRAFQNSGSAKVLLNSALNNFFTLKRVQ